MGNLTKVLLGFALVVTGGGLWFAIESIREKEVRSPKAGLALAAFGLVLVLLILYVPGMETPIAAFFGLTTAGFLLCLIPSRADSRFASGSMGHVVGDVERVDERTIVFARNRAMPPDDDKVREFYDAHPEWEEIDARRRDRGGPLGSPPGRIDKSYRPNVSMIMSAFQLPGMVGPHAQAEPAPGHPPANLDPERAARIVKNYARHLGADLVGICKVNPLWIYGIRGEIHYGNWDDWGREIKDFLPYAVVIATEMDHRLVGAGPHTPCAVESAQNYAKGAYITTILTRWFSMMGYSASADHNRFYKTLLVPLAVDAGLGEPGRHGYLIAPKFGPRVRLFAALTDMPLTPDRPISIGADEFCRKCKKCAEACPSRSIPLDGKIVHNGVEKWKLNAESCFNFWGAVGTDCSICMGICPFSRPNTPLHSIVRRFVAHTFAGKHIFPYIDNYLYGKKWRPRPAPSWVDFPKGPEIHDEVYGGEETRKTAEETQTLD